MNDTLKVAGHGRYLPRRKLTAQELEADLGLPAGWVMRHTGVQERYFVTGEDNATMGAIALERALDHAGLLPADLDLVICASGSYDRPIPFNACLLLHKLGWTRPVHCFDVDATCLSFLVAFDLAATLLAAGRHQRIAIVTSEIASHSLNRSDPKTYCLFGDGAAAFILEPGHDEPGHDEPGRDGVGVRVLERSFSTFAAGANLVGVKGGGNAHHPRWHPFDESDYLFRMEAFELLRFTIPHFDRFFVDFMQQCQLTPADLALIIPHQVSRVGLDHLQRAHGLDPATLWTNLTRYGNCVAASIPLAFSEALDSGRLQTGDNLLLVGTAAGVSLGALRLQVA